MSGVVQVGILWDPTLKEGFDLCVFMTSADSRRNTHTLAPITAVLLRKTNFSSKVYMPPGIVPKGPVNSANDTSVPYSDSKRSISGVTAIRLKIIWTKFQCKTGNKLSRCICVRSILAGSRRPTSRIQGKGMDAIHSPTMAVTTILVQKGRRKT